jgi:hypothetical protein
MKQDDKNRGTGRTTGLILIAIGNSSLSRGEWVAFTDHHKPTTGALKVSHVNYCRNVMERLGLKGECRIIGGQVMVRSLVKDIKQARDKADEAVNQLAKIDNETARCFLREKYERAGHE